MTSRKARRINASCRRWPSSSPPTGVEAGGNAEAPQALDMNTHHNIRDEIELKHFGRREDDKPTSGRSPPGGDTICRGGQRGCVRLQPGQQQQQQEQQQQQQQWQALVNRVCVDDEDEGYPDIPTDDFQKYMAALVEGIRADGVELASTAREVVANTFQVVVRPLEAVARLAAPFLQQQPIISRESNQRGQVQLDDAIAFRMPVSLRERARASPFAPVGAAASNVPGGEDVKDVGALRSIYGNSPPRRSTSPGSRSLSRSRGAVMNKDGNGWQKLGAVKLALTPPELNRQGSRRRASCSPRSRRAGDTSFRECSPTARPRGDAGGHISRRLSISTSPCRNNGRVSGIISAVIGDRDESNGVRSRSHIAHLLNSPRRTAASDAPDTSERASAAGGDLGCTLSRIRRESNSPCRPVVEGSRLDLRALDSVKTGKADRPKAYECTDGSFVILGRERMVSVRPEEGYVGEIGWDGGTGGRARYARNSGVVTWVVRYGEVESCCVNVSAGKGAQRYVGDVVVEVTTRPGTGRPHGTKPSKHSFCLRNPSDCLELLRSVRARWQPPHSPSNSGNKPSSTVSKEGFQEACAPRRGGGVEESNSKGASDDGCEKSPGLRKEGGLSPQRTRDLLAFSPSEKGVDLGSENRGRDGDGCGDGGADMQEMSPFGGLKNEIAVLESPAKLLREQLRERHEEHEKGLMEHLKSKARASKANLQRRRDHRRSISQGPAAVHLLSCSPARVPQSPAQPQTVARTEGVGGTESGGLGEGTSVDSESSTSEHAPDLAVYKKMLKNGVPEGAVRQKMVKDGRVDDASIAAVFSASTLEAIRPPLPLQLPMSPPLCRAEVSSSAESNPSLEACSQLLKDCVPATEVGQKVGIDSAPPSSIQASVHEGGENSGSSGGGTSRPTPTPPPLVGACLLPVANRRQMLPPPPPPPLPSPRRPGNGAEVAGGGLTVVAGGGRVNLELASPPPCSPLGSSKDRERGFFRRGGAGTMTVTPPDTPSRRRTSVPLLNLHWDVLPATAIGKTVWGRTKAKGTSEGDFTRPLEIVDDDEVEELEKLFSKKEASAMSPRATPRGVSYGDCGIGSPGVTGARSVGSKGGPAFFGDGFEAVAVGGRMKKVQLLDVGRGNNVAIGLKSFKMAGGVRELANVIRRLDPNGILTVEDLQRLEACLPTGPELQQVLAYDGPAEALGPAESFFQALTPTPRPAEKVSLMLFALQFPSIAEVTGARLETLRMACQETTSSDRLARVLDRVLVIGNLLNEGTYKGNACGFRLSSLLKLSHTKSHADNKTTVLRYMVRSLGAKVKAKEKAITEAAAAAAAVADEPAASSNTNAETAETCALSTLSPSSETGENDQLTPSPMSLASTPSKTNIPTGSTAAARQDKSTNSKLPRSHRHRRTSSNTSVTSDSATPVRTIASTKKPSPAEGSAWTRGAPPGCVRAASSALLSDRNHIRVTVGGPTAASRRLSAVSVSPRSRGNDTVGSAVGGRACGSGGKNAAGDGRGHGRGRTNVGGTGRPSAGGGPGAARGARNVKVEMLDLEAELGHLRAASKVPIGDIMMDVRQAKRGLKQAKDELQLVLAENERQAAAVAPVDLQNIGEAENRKEGVEGKGKSESTSQPMKTKDAVAELDGLCEEGGGRCENDHKESGDAGVDKLVEFVASAKTRLAAIEESANQCVVLCKSLGEFFGEDVSGDGTQSSAHIFKTLVQFLDLLAEAKQAEGLS